MATFTAKKIDSFSFTDGTDTITEGSLDTSGYESLLTELTTLRDQVKTLCEQMEAEFAKGRVEFYTGELPSPQEENVLYVKDLDSSTS